MDKTTTQDRDARAKRRRRQVADCRWAAADFFSHPAAADFGELYARYIQGLVTRGELEHYAYDVLGVDATTLDRFEALVKSEYLSQ